MQFWQGFIALSALAAVFIIWPTLFVKRKYKAELRSGDTSDALKEVYSQQIEDLEQTLTRGEIEQKEFKRLKVDLEKTLAEDSRNSGLSGEAPIISSIRSRIPVIALTLIIPVMALVLYSNLGAKDDWEIYDLMVQPVTTMEEAKGRGENLIEMLQERLKEKPNNANNWYLLATTSLDMGLYDEAVLAYRKVLDLSPGAPRIMAELAQALFSRAGNTITPEVRQYTNDALAKAPMLPTALGLAGVDSFQSGDYAGAIQHWQNAISQLDPSSAAYQVLSSGVEKAKMALKESGGEMKASAEPQAEGADKPSIMVSVKLDEKVQASPEDTVFIYARAWKGPKMPLAIQRMTVADLPVTVKLSESMMPGMDLSSFPQVEVIARISAAGSPVPAPGDWEGAQGPVIVANQDGAVKLTISTLIE